MSPMDFMGPACDMSFFATPCTEAETIKVISSFASKGCHTKEVSMFIYKQVIPYIGPIITNLFNNSISEGVFPSILKVARVIPIFKSGSRNSVKNYRPISTLPVLSKIFEKLMFVRINNFFNVNNVICKHQFGFRKGYSTADALLEFLDSVYLTLDQSRYLVSVFLDLSKAFDTVNHQLLLRKLHHVGIRGVSNEWFKSYLDKRVQYVSVLGEASSLADVQTGVPQGSVLGPSLFLMYINDMYRSAPDVQFVHYADDTTVFDSGNDICILTGEINRNLQHVDRWLQCNRLSLNVTKTSYIIFSNRAVPENVSVQIRNSPVAQVNEMKFLGVTIDSNLKFKAHVNQVCARLSRSAGMLRKVSASAPNAVLRSLYFGLVYPVLIYGITAWGKCNVTSINRLKSVHRRCLAPLSCRNGLNVCQSNNLLDFDDVSRYFVLVKMFNVMRGDGDQYFARRVFNYINLHTYTTRFKEEEKLAPPVFKKALTNSSFITQAICEWNKLPITMRNCESLTKFKKDLKIHLLS